MQLALIQALQFGYLETFVQLEGWMILLCGGLVQLLLVQKTHSRRARWSFAGILLIALLLCDIACQIVTGWDLLISLLTYCFFLTLLIGAALCALILFVTGRYARRQ